MIKKDLSLQLSNIELLEKGFNIICDRYTTSNILHMSANLTNEMNIEKYINWIEDLEYYELGLPKPDKVIYLDVTPEVSMKNMMKRYNNDEEKMDINENLSHLSKVYKMKDEIIKYCGWTKIDCMDPNNKNEMAPFDRVHELIYAEVKKELSL
jgi:dTMP kinase